MTFVDTRQMYLAPLTKLFTEPARQVADLNFSISILQNYFSLLFSTFFNIKFGQSVEFAVVAYRSYPPWSDYTTQVRKKRRKKEIEVFYPSFLYCQFMPIYSFALSFRFCVI